MTPFPMPSAILFDLDGTLIDTAPDLAFALNTLLKEEGKSTLPYSRIRPVASHGSHALIELGFAITANDPDFPQLQRRFISLYQTYLTRETRLFPGMHTVLDTLEKRALPFGVVTNKPTFLTHPLLEQLSLDKRMACIVCGDTVAQSKPHPAPLLHACHLINQTPDNCIYIGDAQRDIEAGKNAGMHTAVALYGYIADDEHPHLWQADTQIQMAQEILTWL